MRRSIVPLSLFAMLLAPLAAEATVMVPLSVEDLTARSAMVMRGRVLAQQASWDDNQRKIYTFTEIEVLSTVHTQNAAPERVFVRSMGGEVGDVGMRVAGTPKFSVGEEVFLFLRVDPKNAEQFQVVGMSQGKFTVTRDGGVIVAIPSAEGIAYVRPNAQGVLQVDEGHSPVTSRMPIADLEARVKKALAAPTSPKAPTSPTAPAAPTTPTSPTVIGQ
ncbi:MAG: hypothetical protein RMA76_01950 [Deltaproteobacteria bacterium]|jgi:hypothetical protein